MFSNRLAFAALGAACIAAAAGGGYVASRQDAVPAPASAMTVPQVAPSAPAEPVQETETVVRETVETPSESTAPSVRSSSTRNAQVNREPVRSTGARPARPARTASAPVGRTEGTPTLQQTWPSSASVAPPSAPAPVPETSDNAPAFRPDERAAQEAPRAPEPPERTFEELVVSADSVLGLQTETRLSSETARVEDRVEARVTRDVKVADRVAIPSGARALGSVTLVERGGKFKERARLGIQFHTLVLADGTRLPLKTETIYRAGDAPGNSSAAKIGGGAVGGAILGAILGGAKGAAIGATTGAGGGAAVVAAGDRNAATLPAGTPMTVRVLAPVTVTVEN